jgi:hypothetical protein
VVFSTLQLQHGSTYLGHHQALAGGPSTLQLQQGSTYLGHHQALAGGTSISPLTENSILSADRS